MFRNYQSCDSAAASAGHHTNAPRHAQPFLAPAAHARAGIVLGCDGGEDVRRATGDHVAGEFWRQSAIAGLLCRLLPSPADFFCLFSVGCFGILEVAFESAFKSVGVR